MSSSEIRQYIQQLAEQDKSKLTITSEVMRKYGTIYHYSFKEWCRIVSEELHYSQTDVLDDELIDDEDIISPKEIHSTQDLDCDINEKEPRTEKEKSANVEPATKFSVTAIDYSALKNNGIFKVTFGDSYEVSDILLKNVFQRMLFHIGFMRVKELDIKVNSLPLIMYVFHNHFNYEKCLPYASYYICKMNDEQMVETLCEIITKLEIEATLEKDKNVILKSLLSSQSSLGAEEFPCKERVNSEERNNQTQKDQSNIIDSLKPNCSAKAENISQVSSSKNFDDYINLDASKFKNNESLPLIPFEESDNKKTIIFKSRERKRITKKRVLLTKVEYSTSAEKNENKDLFYFIECLQKIKDNTAGEAVNPSLPIFILTILELIHKNIVTINMFKIDYYMATFYMKLWSRHSNTNCNKVNVADPYVNFFKSGLWEFTLKDNAKISEPTKSEVLSKVRYAFLNQELFYLLKFSNNRMIMKHFVINYFNLKP